MKVVKETPTEDVKFENIFGEPYEVTLTPSMQDEECIFVDEIDTLQDAVICLAEDVMEHEDVLHMLGEKTQVNEDGQVKILGLMDDLQQACKMMLDVIITLNKESNRNTRLLCIILVRLTVLTVGFGIYVF